MNNKYDIEMGIDSYPSRKVKGRYDDEHVLVDVPLETEENKSKGWKKTFKNLQYRMENKYRPPPAPAPDFRRPPPPIPPAPAPRPPISI